MSTSDTETRSYPGPVYSWYVVFLLMTFYVLSFLDRQIIAVLAEPIKSDLLLTDVQLSLLGGLAFLIFYSIAGIFVGRLADIVHRPTLIGLGVFLWSATTAACGATSNFVHLLLLRMGVGLGEATLMPSSLSLLTDLFPKEKLGKPTSVFMLGAPLGIGVAFTGGAYLYDLVLQFVETTTWQNSGFADELRPWQLVLITLGVTGMIMSLLLTTVRDPRRNRKTNTKGDAGTTKEVKAYFIKNRLGLGGLFIGMSFVSLASYAQGFWDIAFLVRTYGWEPTTAGLYYGLLQLFSGVGGMVFGGYISDKLSTTHGPSKSYSMILVALGIAIPFTIAYPIAPTPWWSLSLMLFAIFGNNMAYACATTTLQRIFPVGMLGLSLGIYFFMSNVVGMGAGPTLVAMVTDYVFGDPSKLGYSLSIIVGSFRVLAFLLILMALKRCCQMIERI